MPSRPSVTNVRMDREFLRQLQRIRGNTSPQAFHEDYRTLVRNSEITPEMTERLRQTLSSAQPHIARPQDGPEILPDTSERTREVIDELRAISEVPEITQEMMDGWIRPAQEINQTSTSYTIGDRPFMGIRRSPRSLVNAPTHDEQEEENEMATVGSMVNHRPDIASMVTHPMIIGTGKVGIEVELERASRRNMRFWQSTTDQSLREGGIEYILNQPLGGRDLQEAIFELDTNMHEISPDANWRCSTHIHLDVRDMTVPQLKKFILAYTSLERIIFQCSGIQRWDNNFCPSFGFAEGQISKLARIWNKTGRAFVQALDTSGNQGDRDKYSSLNFLPIRRQGSVEFRGSEAKFRKGQLLRLANRILSLRELAVTFTGTDEELVTYIATHHPSKILKKSMPGKFFLNQEELHAGCDLAMDIIHLGKLTNAQNSADIEVRTRWPQEWADRFGFEKPDRIAASALQELCEEHECWAGDFIHENSVSAYANWASANEIEF